jgi:hypothetical protein
MEGRVMETWQSPEIDQLVAAIIKSQLEMRTAKRDTTNTFFKSKYADLPECWDAIESFRKNGIAIVQLPMPGKEHHITLDSLMAHTSGQFLRSRLEMPLAKVDPQGAGSAITYGRRYALGCMTGLVTDEDDDGNAVSTNRVRGGESAPTKLSYQAAPDRAQAEGRLPSPTKKPENGPVTQLPPAAVAPPQAQDSSGPIIWNASKPPHRGKNIREVDEGHLKWYEKNGPQDAYREMARVELDRRYAEQQFEMEVEDGPLPQV